MMAAMEGIKPTKKCPKCRSKSLRELYSEKIGEFVGYQCERCFHWWEPKGGYEIGLHPTSMIAPFDWTEGNEVPGYRVGGEQLG